MTCIGDIEKLVELFQIANNENQYDDEEEEQNVNDIQCSTNENASNKPQTSKKKQNPYSKVETPKRTEILDPEAADPEELYFDQVDKDAAVENWKNTPKWDISYRQSVSASDVFLGMGFKNTSTSSCENMVVVVEMPGENRQNIDLQIQKEKLILTSPKFFLDLKLPHPVDPERGNAEFDKDSEKLIITLVMDRELDILNF